MLIMKAAQVIRRAVEQEKLPFRLLTGNDAFRLARADPEGKAREITDWEALSTATDEDR